MNQKLKEENQIGLQIKSIAQSDYMIIVIIVVSFIKMLFVTTLFIFHTTYILRGVTTYLNNKYEELIAYHGNIYSSRSMKLNFINRIVKKHTSKFDFKSLGEDKTFLDNGSVPIMKSGSQFKFDNKQQYSSMIASEEDKLVKSTNSKTDLTVKVKRIYQPSRALSSFKQPSAEVNPTEVAVTKFLLNNAFANGMLGGANFKKKEANFEDLHNNSYSSSKKGTKKHQSTKANVNTKIGKRQTKSTSQEPTDKFKNSAFKELLQVGKNGGVTPYQKKTKKEVMKKLINGYSASIMNSEGNLFQTPKIKISKKKD